MRPATSTATPTNRCATDWETIRREAIAGAPTAALSQAHGISQRAIQRRAERDSWPTPERIRRQERENWRRGDMRQSGGSQDSAGGTAATRTLPAVLDGAMSLADPKQFLGGIAEWVARLIAESLEHIPPPRNMRELAMANEIYRKAAGIDTPGKQLPRPLFNFAPGVKIGVRKPCVIEA